MLDIFVILVVASNFLTGPQMEHWAGEPSAFTSIEACETELNRRIAIEVERWPDAQEAIDKKAVVFNCVRLSDADLDWARKYPYPGDMPMEDGEEKQD